MPFAEFNQELLDFIEKSPTPFHATQQMAAALEQSGFEPLDETEAWSLSPSGAYYCTRNDSSLIAFRWGELSQLLEQGLPMVGAHTDSPCLKVKPQPDSVNQGVAQLGVEVYGGALLNPWFDRDLSLAGRVQGLDASGSLVQKLLNVTRPIAFIPSLAIHLDRQANKERTINPQVHLPAIWSLEDAHAQECTQADANHQSSRESRFRDFLLKELQCQDADIKEVLDFEMLLYDSHKPSLLGLNNEFITSARLDNLLSCFIALKALVSSTNTQPALIVCTDHEEVGSASACGAQGPFLQDVLKRLLPEPETRIRILQRSMMISADNAHGVHPNYADRHDGQHSPKLNQGPVIKINANQRYATTSETGAKFRQLCSQVQVPVQTFVTRSDLGCGSTIGPITASQLGVATLDVGVPQWGMHSCREICGSQDPYSLFKVFSAFFSRDE